jgi:hypothetical protein
MADGRTYKMKTHLSDRLIILLLVLLSVIATAQVDVEDITDLDASNDLNELLDALEGENIESSMGGVDDVDDMIGSEDCDAAAVDNASTVEEESTLTIDEDLYDATFKKVVDEEIVSNEPSEGSEAAASEAEQVPAQPQQPPTQTGPFIDIFGDVLLSLEMVDETHAQVHQHFTNEALAGKKVVGLYFSADWCGPCRQFTPDLVQFYDKMNSRRGKQDEFEIVWISRCRSVDDFGQYFTHMKWLALPPQEAMVSINYLLYEYCSNT